MFFLTNGLKSTVVKHVVKSDVMLVIWGTADLWHTHKTGMGWIGLPTALLAKKQLIVGFLYTLG